MEVSVFRRISSIRKLSFVGDVLMVIHGMPFPAMCCADTGVQFAEMRGKAGQKQNRLTMPECLLGREAESAYRILTPITVPRCSGNAQCARMNGELPQSLSSKEVGAQSAQEDFRPTRRFMSFGDSLRSKVANVFPNATWERGPSIDGDVSKGMSGRQLHTVSRQEAGAKNVLEMSG